MSKTEFGGPGEIPPVEVNCPCDEFENAIKKIGVVNACEWFGYESFHPFTLATIQDLKEKAGLNG